MDPANTNTNTNTILLLNCANCDKKYKSQIGLNKHKLLCCDKDGNPFPIVENKPPHEAHHHGSFSMNEVIDICKEPSMLMQSVAELIKSNNKLRMEVEELKRCNRQSQNKKIVVIEWLNKNYKPPLNYIKFMGNLVIGRPQLEIIFNSNFILGIEEILQEYLGEFVEKNIPFKSFTQKKDIIYAYNEENKWERIAPETFNGLLLTLGKNLLTEFAKWQAENEDKLYNDDFSTIYLENLKKVLGGNNDIEKSQRQIYKNFYQYLKKDFQSIVQFDFA